MTHSGRFDAFVWISAGLHVLVATLVLAWALSAPRPKPPVAIFEMVGIPPRGNGGGEIRPTPPAPAPAPPAAEAPAEPEKVPQKPAPTPTPDKASAKVLPKAAPTPVTKPRPGPVSTKPAPTTGTAKTESAKDAGTATAGTHPGTPGRPDGDTLSVSGAQGLPSPMAFWLSRVKYTVERNWRAPDGLAGVTAMPEVVFQVSRDGRPSRVQLKKKSGNATLDRLALRAVQAVESFPPVPDVWPQNDVVVRYVLQYASQ